LRVARQLKIPVLYEIRGFWEDAAANHGTSPEGGMRYLLTRALETYVLRHVDAATTICDGLRRDILARGIPGLDITVVPNAVDGESVHEPLRTNHALAGKLRLKGLILGFIGSFYAYEGLAFLLNAMPRLLAVLPSVQLLLVGGGPQEGNYAGQEAQAARQGQLYRPRAAARDCAILQANRYPGLPTSAHAADRAGDAAKTPGSHGAWPHAHRLRRWWTPGNDRTWQDRNALHGR
jgi:glycosyltransferase involved in cell wall biosynthesis